MMEPHTDGLTMLFVALIVILPPVMHHLFGEPRHPPDGDR